MNICHHGMNTNGLPPLAKSRYLTMAPFKPVFVCGCIITCCVITLGVFLPKEFSYNVVPLRSPAEPRPVADGSLSSRLTSMPNHPLAARLTPLTINSVKQLKTKSKFVVSQPSPIRVKLPEDYLTRKDALLIPECTDTKIPPNIKTSRLYRRSPAKTQLGSQIRVSVQLYNGYNKSVTTGGHLVRARLYNTDLQAGVPGRVEDHQNGTYTVTVDALWVGNATVQVTLAFSREAIRAMYVWRKKSIATCEQSVTYTTDPGIEERCQCHVFPRKLTRFPALCNFTYENSGTPWYCGAPSHKKLLCEDITSSRTRCPRNIPISKLEENLIRESNHPIKQELSFDVLEGSVPGQKVVKAPSIPCVQYNTATLWDRSETTGLFYNGTWRLRHCQAPSPSKVHSCLRNRRLLLLADSTARHWFVDLRTRFHCQLVTQYWDVEARWHRRTECVVKSNKLQVTWAPHGTPFQVGNEKPMYSWKSVARHLADIGDTENAIVLIHVFIHLLAYEEDVYRLKIKIIRKGIEAFFKRNKVAKVFIKSPHTYTNTFNFGRPDFYGYVYRRIILEEFDGLYDRVIYLDNFDATIAQNSYPIHPTFDIVSGMVDQMFAYVC